MKVYGYRPEEKLPIAVDISVEEVVRLGIHPWQVDLWESDPIVREGIHFTRLRDVTFAYRHHNELIIGMLHGGAWSVLRGEVKKEINAVTVQGLHKAEGNLEAHLLKFLLDESPDKLMPFSKGHKLEVDPDGCVSYPIARWFSHTYADRRLAYEACLFAGNMFDRVELFLPMPQDITWVWEVFRELNPTIFGGALRDLVRGAQHHDVDFIVDTRTVDEMKAFLLNAGVTDIRNLTATDRYGWVLEAPVIEFGYNGTTYHLVCRGNPLSDWMWELNDFSVNQLMAERPEVVQVSRVGLWDLAHNQARIVSRAHENRAYDLIHAWPMRTQKLSSYGFRILPNLFAQDWALAPAKVGLSDAQTDS